MSTETDRLAREAEQRRSSLDQTLDSLKEKFSPGQIVDEVASYVRSGQGAEMVQNLNRQVRDNPLALGLIGAGAAWLLLGQGVRDSRPASLGSTARDRFDDASPDRWAPDDRDNRFEGPLAGRNAAIVGGGSAGRADIGGWAGASSSSSPGVTQRTRDVASSAAGAVGSAASSVGGTVSSAASTAGSAVSDAASSVADAVSGAASSVASGASHLTESAGDAVSRAGQAGYRTAAQAGDRVAAYGRQAKRSFFETLQDEPLVLGAVAIAIGAAIGAALPSTRTEDEWLGETRDKLRDDALDYGRDTLDKAQTVAGKAYEAASAEAEDKGLVPKGGEGETIADKLSSVVKAATDGAKDEAGKQGLV
ncbi:MAG: DUF3618 domain-containing protein [Methylobacterium sp.]